MSVQGWNDPFPGRPYAGAGGGEDDRPCEVCGEMEFCDDMTYITNLGFICDNCKETGYDND